MCYVCVCRLVDCEVDGMKYKEFCEFAMKHAGEMNHEQLMVCANVMLDVIANRCIMDEDAYFTLEWLGDVMRKVLEPIKERDGK